MPVLLLPLLLLQVSTYLEQDLFPRYLTWIAEQSRTETDSRTTNASLLDQSRLGDRKAMREALVALIQIPSELEAMKVTARKV